MTKSTSLERRAAGCLISLGTGTFDFGGNYALEIYHGDDGGACDSGLPANSPKGMISEYLAAVVAHVRARRKDSRDIQWRNEVIRASEDAYKAVFGGEGKRFFKTVIVLEVLSENRPATDMELSDLAYEITEGAFSGRTVSETVTMLSARQAARALERQGSDPGFFGIGDDEDEGGGESSDDRLAQAA